MNVSMNKVDHTAVVVTEQLLDNIRFQRYDSSPYMRAGVSIDQELMDTECIQPYIKDVVQLSRRAQT